MKSSLFLAVAGAVLVTAGPVQKRALVTDWVEEIVTVTVTAQPPKPTTHSVSHPPKPKVTKAPVVAAAAAAVEKPKSSAPPPPPVVQPTTTAPVVKIPTPEVVVQKPKPAPIVVTKPAPKPAPSSNGNGGGSAPANDYQSVVLEQHNLHRSNHSASDLSWSDDLASSAQSHASSCKFEHDRSGQNLASWGSSSNLGSASEAAARGITEQWYNGEMPSYSPFYGEANPPGSIFEKVGHFTQVVWKSTTKVGCATVKCPAGTVLSFPSFYTVCNYDPAGNFGGEYGANVLKPGGASIASV